MPAPPKALKLYGRKFVAEGKGSFPYDMLRYDSCFPADPSATTGISPGIEERRVITLVSYQGYRTWQPTRGRWASFGWAVSEAEAC